MDDATLLQRLRAGDEHAFDLLIDTYYRPLLNWIVPVAGSVDAAEDVLQTLFVRLWERRATLEVHGSLRAYLYRAAHNLALNERRGHTTRHRIEQRADLVHETDVASIEDTIDATRLAELVRTAMQELPPRCREIYALHREHHLSYPEIAATLEISLSTVKTQMGRAVTLLATKLGPLLAGALVLVSTRGPTGFP